MRQWKLLFLISDVETADFVSDLFSENFLFLIRAQQIFVSDLDSGNFCF
jgi:hypothetical protein